MTTVAVRPELRRPRRVVIAGVCASVAFHLNWTVGRTRLLTIVLALCGGGGVLLYLWLWALVPLVPTETEDQSQVRRAAPIAAIFVGAAAWCTLIIGAVLLGSSAALVTPALLGVTLASAAAVTWSLAFDRHDPTRSRAYGLGVRSLSSALLLVSGVTVLLALPTAVNAVIAVGVLVLGIALLVAPRVVALWTDLMKERTTRVREEQRAEIAAHLHDSVLQTLALIQNRAGPSSEVARIARAQERELRDWLFLGDAPVAADLSAELREVAAALELSYPVRIEVVSTGDSVPGIAALVAASREAMLNAARHVGGDVSVYLETTASAIDIWVRDRGDGVDLDTLPSDRLGIRESIIGRMTRAGGSATVRPGTGGSGTEVHLHLETQQ